MGRTQPPLTASVDAELEKLTKIVDRVGSPCLKQALAEASKRVRYFQSASYDELVSPQEVVTLALLSVVAEGICTDGRLRG